MASRFAIETIFSARDKLTAPVNKMRTAINGLSRSASRDFLKLNRAVDLFNSTLINTAKYISVTLAGSAYGIVRAFNDMGDSLGSLNDEANRLDFPIEQLQIYQFIGKNVGIKTDELSRSIAIFTKNIGAAKNGQGGLNSALKKTNPQLLQQFLNAKSTSEAFEIGIDAIRRQTTAFGKASMANTLFGKSGQRMIGIANLSAEEFNKLRNAAIDNGIVTAEQAAMADDYGDKLASLTTSFLSLRNSALIPLIPKMQEATDKFQGFINANRGFAAAKIGSAFDFFINNLDDLKTVLSGVVDLLKIYLMFSVALKAITITTAIYTGLVTAVTWLYQTALIATNFQMKWLTAMQTLSIGRFIIWASVMGIVTAGMWILNGALTAVRVATMLFNVALWANPIGAMIAGIIALIAIIGLLIYNWKSVSAFFSDLWTGIIDTFSTSIDKIKGLISTVTEPLSKIFGGAFSIYQNANIEAGQQGNTVAPQLVTSSEQITRSITENRETIGIDITGGYGQAKVTQKTKSGNISVRQRTSGAF